MERTLTIPQCRERLIAISDKLRGTAHADEIRLIVEQMKRRPPVRMARPKMRSLTPELRAEIIAYADVFPDENYMEIGRAFNVSSGRVSEALAGFRQAA